MKSSIQSTFFNLLLDVQTKNDGTSEIENAYDYFYEEMTAFCSTEETFISIIRKLNFTRIELESIKRRLLCGQGEKCLKN